MKRFRILFGGLIIAAALWLIIDEQLSGTSANATINAQLSTLRTPIAGQIVDLSLPIGARLEAGQRLAEIRNLTVDIARLNDLLLEREKIQIERTNLARNLTVLEQNIAELEVRSELFDRGRIVELEIQLAAAKTRLGLLLGLPAMSPDQLEEELAKTEEMTRALAAASIEIVSAREQVDLLQNELEITLAGVYLGDGYNDAPFSSQQYQALKSQQSSMHNRLEMMSELLSAVDERIRLERQQLSLLEAAVLVSTTDGVLFDILATDNEVVNRGDPVLTIADCTNVFITLSVTQSLFNSLSLGDSAQFRPTGSSRVFDGTVTRLAGSGADRVYSDLAVAPSDKHLERYDVALLVPDMKNDAEFACAIGRTGRVYFEARPLDWFRSGS